MGHSWGEVKIADGGSNEVKGHLASNQIGNGEPNIMVARGSKVDAAYTRNPQAGNSKLNDNSNNMNPDKRKVTQKNIDWLHLEKLNFDSKGKANLGRLTNIVH